MYEVPRVVKLIEIGSRMVVVRGWGRKDGSFYLMGIEIVPVLQDEKNSVDWLYISVNVLNAKLYI